MILHNKVESRFPAAPRWDFLVYKVFTVHTRDRQVVFSEQCTDEPIRSHGRDWGQVASMEQGSGPLWRYIQFHLPDRKRMHAATCKFMYTVHHEFVYRKTSKFNVWCKASWFLCDSVKLLKICYTLSMLVCTVQHAIGPISFMHFITRVTTFI